jgi:hypothetical protein
MRTTTAALISALGLATLGCSGQPDLRPEPVEVKVAVKIPGGASAKDLQVMLQPQQNTQPGTGKVGADGTFTTKVVPGKYIPYIDEGNSKHPAYNSIPQSYKTPTAANAISIDGAQPVTIEVK